MDAIKHLKGHLDFYLKEGKTEPKKKNKPKPHTQNTTTNETQYFAAEWVTMVTAVIYLHWVVNSLRK